MYEYKVERIKLGAGFFSMELEPKEDYREIVKDYAQNGWRLVQVFSPAVAGTGRSSFYDIIFEREN